MRVGPPDSKTSKRSQDFSALPWEADFNRSSGGGNVHSKVSKCAEKLHHGLVLSNRSLGMLPGHPGLLLLWFFEAWGRATKSCSLCRCLNRDASSLADEAL